jgi:hypothetical protein
VDSRPRPDGTWSGTAAVPQSAVPGPGFVRARCLVPNGTKAMFSYPAVAVDMRSFRRLEVSPGTTVRAGTTLEVTAVGACPSPCWPTRSMGMAASRSMGTRFGQCDARFDARRVTRSALVR